MNEDDIIAKILGKTPLAGGLIRRAPDPSKKKQKEMTPEQAEKKILKDTKLGGGLVQRQGDKKKKTTELVAAPGPEYIEDGYGGVIKVEPGGSETMIMAPKGGFFKPPADPAVNKQLLDEYLSWKSQQRKE